MTSVNSDTPNKIHLGINIDHAATIRQQRNTSYPDLAEIVQAAERGGADGITLHLREDRRHIQDADVVGLKSNITTKMNLEMAATQEMLDIACKVKPEDVCLVPEKREELTTEGGLDVLAQKARLTEMCSELSAREIRISMFIEPAREQIEASAEIGAVVVELHTGKYADLTGAARDHELQRLHQAASFAHSLGLIVNAGHGLEYENVIAVKDLPHLHELNIGHSIIARALLVGVESAVAEMKKILE